MTKSEGAVIERESASAFGSEGCGVRLGVSLGVGVDGECGGPLGDDGAEVVHSACVVEDAAGAADGVGGVVEEDLVGGEDLGDCGVVEDDFAGALDGEALDVKDGGAAGGLGDDRAVVINRGCWPDDEVEAVVELEGVAYGDLE